MNDYMRGIPPLFGRAARLPKSSQASERTPDPAQASTPELRKQEDLDADIDKMLTWNINGHTEPVIFQPEMKAAIRKLFKKHLKAHTERLCTEARIACLEELLEIQTLYPFDNPDWHYVLPAQFIKDRLNQLKGKGE